MTTFGQPDRTVPADLAVEAAGIVVPKKPPLPPLVDPAPPEVDQPADEPMVSLEHRRILTLDSYAEAGWSGAQPGTWLRRSAAERLARVAESLPERWGLAVFDAWRPLCLQAELFEAAYADPALPPGFVSVPDSDPRTPPPHLTGGTVDLTLTLDGLPLAPGSTFDDFTERAHTASLEGVPSIDRSVRRLLYWSMRRQGFVVLHCEWWHFEFGTRRWAAITGGPPRYGPTRPPERG